MTEDQQQKSVKSKFVEHIALIVFAFFIVQMLLLPLWIPFLINVMTAEVVNVWTAIGLTFLIGMGVTALVFMANSRQ